MRGRKKDTHITIKWIHFELLPSLSHTHAHTSSSNITQISCKLVRNAHIINDQLRVYCEPWKGGGRQPDSAGYLSAWRRSPAGRVWQHWERSGPPAGPQTSIHAAAPGPRLPSRWSGLLLSLSLCYLREGGSPVTSPSLLMMFGYHSGDWQTRSCLAIARRTAVVDAPPGRRLRARNCYDRLTSASKQGVKMVKGFI